MKKIEIKDLFKGLTVQDSSGRKGIIRDCKDLHNVHVTFEGKGIQIDWYETPFECGGNGFYCFVEDCDCEKQESLYHS